MSTYNISIEFDDQKEANSLLALKKIDAANDGESNLSYLQRVVLESLIGKINDGQVRLAQELIASQIQDPGVTILNE